MQNKLYIDDLTNVMDNYLDKQIIEKPEKEPMEIDFKNNFVKFSKIILVLGEKVESCIKYL